MLVHFEAACLMLVERDIRTMRFRKGDRISCLGARDEKVDNTILRSTVSQSIQADLAMDMFHDSDSDHRSVLLPLCRLFCVW